MGYPETFEGFRSQSHKDWTTFKKESWTPKKWEDRDVDVKIDACGVCGSDVHTIDGGWGEAPMPLCVGHEVIGKVVKIGDKATTGLKVGDRVGVGAQIASCLECKVCKSDNENYCPKMVDTYGAPQSDGSIAQGGYASHIRAHEYFTFKIPDEIPTHEAAPMLCAGITTFSPLYRAKVGKGSQVAVVGLGGLGHFAVLWAVALGAEVTVLSHSPNKKDDAMKLGAKHFITTGDKDWNKDLEFTYDFILSTVDVAGGLQLADYFKTLKVNAHFHSVGLPDHPLEGFMVQHLVPSGANFGASHLGSRPEMQAMLKLAAEKGVHPIIQQIPISEAGCKEAVEGVKNNKVRYRYTLTDFDKAFGARQ